MRVRARPLDLPLSTPIATAQATLTTAGRIGDKRALKPLCDLLSHEEVVVRQSAANALGLLDLPEVLEPLRIAAATERWWDRGRHRQAIRKLQARQKAPANT